MSNEQRRVISGWGRTSPITANVTQPDLTETVSTLVKSADRVIARGLGRSYGDAAQLGGGLNLDLTSLDRITRFDEVTGRVEVEAGVSIDHLIRVLAPLGWFVPVTPGTRYVTVGGAIASDVHGKNHHAVGTFGKHVIELTLISADGNARTVGPDRDPEIFWATVGGMGLTGVILSATFDMLAIPTAKIRATEQRESDLDSVMRAMTDLDQGVPYSVAWIDTVARGSKFGRGVISSGHHAGVDDLTAGKDPFDLGIPETVAVPVRLPSATLNRLSVGAFNGLWYQKAPKVPTTKLASFSGFFHPLDMVGRWNRIYGRRGFVQYQFAVPEDSAKLVGQAIRSVTATGGYPFLTVLKRFGPSNDSPLSFPIPGWTLALDIPTGVPGLGRVLDQLDEQVAAAGGRVYLSKDARLRPAVLRSMYPRLPEWQELRAQLDPTGKFTSDLALRLGI